MYVDSQLLFSDAQAVTAAAISENILDLGQVRDIGTGQPLYIVTIVDTTMDDAGDDSTLTVSLYGDSTTTITPDASQVLFTIPALAAAGDKFIHALDPASAPLQLQYIALYYTPNNGNLSAGAFTSFITTTIDQFKAYADNVTIS